MPPPHSLRDETLRLNELASKIHTIADARRFIDAITELFADELPPAWTTESLRARLVQGEYLTVTDPRKRISEQHLAQTWNAFVSAMRAPDESQVSAAEIHSLRDAHFNNGRLMWDRGYRNFWLLPSIFAMQPNGTLAPSCRVVESLRILYDLACFPENLRAARERVSNGTLTSDLMKQPQQRPPSSSMGRASVTAGATSNPVEAAARRERSTKAFTEAIETMLNTLLSA